jgi:hypothetical protein
MYLSASRDTRQLLGKRPMALAGGPGSETEVDQLHLAGHRVNQDAARIDIVVDKLPAVQFGKDCRELNSYLEEEIKIATV